LQLDISIDLSDRRYGAAGRWEGGGEIGGLLVTRS
jgi:hypothetical protein